MALWVESYLHKPPSSPQFSPSSTYFYECSKHLSQLSLIQVEIPVSDLQNAIGKSGVPGIREGVRNLKTWIRKSPDCAHITVLTAIKVINSLMPNSGSRGADTGPYGLVSFFLCHVTLWAFVSSATSDQMDKIYEAAQGDDTMRRGLFFPVVQAIWKPTASGSMTVNPSGDVTAVQSDISNEESSVVKVPDGCRLIFRSAAEVLTRLGTWGAALDLAMIFSRRAEM
jgi:hypothetical protein